MSQTALRAEVLVEENAGGSQCRQPNSAPVGRTLGCDNIEIDAIKFYPPQQAQVTQSPGNFMPISLTPHLKRNKVVRYDLRYPGPLVVWWYCGLYKNLQDSTQPLVLVAFRKLMDSQSLSDEIVYQRIPLTALGQFRIGTVWEDGACWMSMSFESQVFDVDFTQHGWALTSFQRRHVLDLPPPYPSEIHPLHYGRDKNWLLEFSLETGGKLIVPCLEFFTRCYGRSAELRRCLATYDWEELTKNRLYAPLNEPEEKGKWKIKLRKRLVGGDSILLAHAKYSPYTQSIVKRIHSDIQVNYDPEGKKPAFIKIAPWFDGPAKLKVKGIWFDQNRSFLALEIKGSSDPLGVPIWKDRETTGSLAAGEGGPAGSGAPIKRLSKIPDIIDLTDAEAPDGDASLVEIEDPDFEILGTPRVIHQLWRSDPHNFSGQARVEATDASTFSSGDPHGSGKGVGYASIHAKPVLESQGTLRDMWNALLFFKKTYPHIIQSVEWFTFDDGYQADTEPKLIAIQPFEDREEGMSSKIWRWPYLDPKTMLEVRGALVMRIKAGDKEVHIVEIQRRPIKKKDKDGLVSDTEESFQGLIFALSTPDDLRPWLTLLLSEVRYKTGVVKHLAVSCPGKADSFNHAPSSGDYIPCVSAARNALGKMGVFFA